MASRKWNILMMGYVWPEITSSAAGLREWNLINTFLENNCHVQFSSAATPNQFTKDLQAVGIETLNFQPNDSSFNQWIKKSTPDFVIFDRFVVEEQFGWRVASESPNTVRVLDTQDLHFLRKARHEALINGFPLQSIFDGDIPLQNENCFRELSSIFRCDLSLILSDFELALLSSKYHISPNLLHLSRFHYKDPLTVSDLPTFEDRKHFCMIGNFRHPPNADGVKWMASEIWPLIKKELPVAELHIYGAYPPREMMELTNETLGLHIKGPVKDHLKMLQKYRVNCAPLRFGAGIKGKITDGWYCGTPVITTPIGSEGMGTLENSDSAENMTWGGSISTSCPQDYANKAISLYSDERKWNSAQHFGQEILRTCHSHKLNSLSLINRFADLQQNLLMSRQENIIGQILQYNTARSTKYFSLWIEEKNRNKKELGGTDVIVK